jgi:hypothetical protein
MFSMIVPLEELEGALKELRTNHDLIKVFVSSDISKREILQVPSHEHHGEDNGNR